MTGARLVLTSALHSQLSREVEASGVEECCGLIVGRADRSAASGPNGDRVATRLLPATNVSRRDRRHHYRIHPTAVLDALGEARLRGEALLGFYHSHPSGGSSPSAVDRASAWTGFVYLIVGEDQPLDLAAWLFSGGAEEPVEIAVTSSLEGQAA